MSSRGLPSVSAPQPTPRPRISRPPTSCSPHLKRKCSQRLERRKRNRTRRFFHMPGRITNPVRKLGVLTGGGDVPGLNAAIKAVVYRAQSLGIEVLGLRAGWEGITFLDRSRSPAELTYNADDDR